MSSPLRTRYDGVAMAIHWVTAVLLIFMVIFGEDLMKDGEKAARSGDAAGATFGPSIHVTIGVTILVLTLIRILWRFTHTAPPYPAGMKRYELIGSKALHGLFYLLLIALPLTGWIAFSGLLEEAPAMAGVTIYGVFGVPQAPFTSHTVKELHELGSNAAIALIVIHVLAALKHQFLDGDGIFRRMLPL